MALTATVRPLDPPAEETVAALLAAAAAGDGVAWSRLVERYRNLLRYVTRAQGLTGEESADVAQTTWLRLLEHVGDVRDPDRLAGWLSTTARRESIAARRRTWHESLTAECPGAAGADPDVEERIVAAQQARDLRRAVERLPAHERRLVELFLEPEPLTYREISARLGIPVGSIGPVRGRALRRLRGLLAGRVEAEDLATSA